MGDKIKCIQQNRRRSIPAGLLHTATAAEHAPLTSKHKSPGAVGAEEEKQTEDAGAQHAHPPELLAEQGGPGRGGAARPRQAREAGVAHQGPGQRGPGAQRAHAWKASGGHGRCGLAHASGRPGPAPPRCSVWRRDTCAHARPTVLCTTQGVRFPGTRAGPFPSRPFEKSAGSLTLAALRPSSV